jgi:hypothetical protein
MRRSFCYGSRPLSWQHLDADRNVSASAAIMRGDPGPMRKLLDELVRDR